MKSKIFSIVIIINLLYLGSIFLIFNNFNQVNNQYKDLINNEIGLVEAATDAGDTIDEMVLIAHQYVLLEDPVKLRVDFTLAENIFDDHMEHAERLLAFDKDDTTDLTAAFVSLSSVKNELVEIIEAENTGIFDLTDTITVKNGNFSEDASLAIENLKVLAALTPIQMVHHRTSEALETISLAQIELAHYEREYSKDQIEAIKYIMGIYNQTDQLATEDVGTFRPLYVIESELFTAIAANATLQTQLDIISSDIYKLKVHSEEFITIISSLIEALDNQKELTETTEKAIDDVSTTIADSIIFATAQIKSSYELTLLITAISTIISLIISIGVSLAIIRSTVNPVKELIGEMEEVANGNLTVSSSTKVARSDEIGKLNDQFEITISNLRGLATEIITSTDLMGRSAEQFSSSAEEINASAQEVSSTAQSMAQGSANQANLVSQIQEQMQNISTLISDIISQIEHNTKIVSQIALQTNILALNAGIEASRAGDYGRGFAVVAENVRKLSDESKNAADNISEVASTISETLQVAFKKIDQDIFNVAAVSEETAASAEEVAAAAEEVTASIEELSLSSQELSENAVKLSGLTNKFTI